MRCCPKTHQPLPTISIYSPLPACLEEPYEHNWMQPFLPSYHSWSVGGKTDAVRCWLVHRHHTGLPLFLTDFSLPPWSHFYQQQSAWSQSQQLAVCKLREVKTPWPSHCPRRHFGLRYFAFVLSYCFVTDIGWHTANPDQLALTVNTWAWLGVYHEPRNFPRRESEWCHMSLGRRIFLEVWAWLTLVHLPAEQVCG